MFTEKHIEACFALFRQLPEGEPFTHLRSLTADDIAIDTGCLALDTLNIGAYAVQQTSALRPTLAGPRPVPVFAVYETVMSSGTRWQPPDADLTEFMQVGSLAEALRAIVLREVEHHVANLQLADELAAAYGPEL